MSQPTDIATLIRRDEQYIRSGLTDNDTRLIWRAMMLAPTLEICEALLRGEDVPRSALDPVWLKRFGL